MLMGIEKEMIWKLVTWNIAENKLSVPVAVAEATLKFTYVEKYPDEPPLWEIFSQDNLEDEDALNILTLLQQQVCSSKQM